MHALVRDPDVAVMAQSHTDEQGVDVMAVEAFAADMDRSLTGRPQQGLPGRLTVVRMAGDL